jgi:hypothetical protein
VGEAVGGVGRYARVAREATDRQAGGECGGIGICRPNTGSEAVDEHVPRSAGEACGR